MEQQWSRHSRLSPLKARARGEKKPWGADEGVRGDMHDGAKNGGFAVILGVSWWVSEAR